MASKAPVVIALLVIAGLGGALAYEATREKPDSAPPSAPPAGPDVVETAPEIISYVMGGKRQDQRQARADEVCGRYVAPPGWESAVEEVTKESGGLAVRMYEHTTAVLGGGYWLIAIVLGDGAAAIQKGDTVRVVGRIRDIEAKTASATVTIRIVLEDAKIVGRKPRPR